MPYNRPGVSVYAHNNSSGIYLHGQPVVETTPGGGKYIGTCVKQKATHWTDGLTAQNQIAIGEQYLIIRQGIVQVADGGAGFVDADPVYITSANALTKTASGNTKFGRVVEVVGDGRGVPTGLVRINLDERDSF